MRRNNIFSSFLIGLLLMLFGLSPLKAQNHYERLDNSVGMNPSSMIEDSLNAVSDSLFDVFLVSAGLNNFTVYDFGFYVYNEEVV